MPENSEKCPSQFKVMSSQSTPWTYLIYSDIKQRNTANLNIWETGRIKFWTFCLEKWLLIFWWTTLYVNNSSCPSYISPDLNDFICQLGKSSTRLCITEVGWMWFNIPDLCSTVCSIDLVSVKLKSILMNFLCHAGYPLVWVVLSIWTELRSEASNTDHRSEEQAPSWFTTESDRQLCQVVSASRLWCHLGRSCPPSDTVYSERHAEHH